MISTHKEDKNKIRLALVFKFNEHEPARKGYRIFVESEGYFEILEELDENKIMDIAHFSALPLMISFTREHLKNMPKNMPYGSFDLPSLDLKNLIDSKY